MTEITENQTDFITAGISALMSLIQKTDGKLSPKEVRDIAALFPKSDAEVRCVLHVLQGVCVGANKRHEVMIDALQRLAIEVVKQHPDANIIDERKASAEEVAEMMPDIQI